MPFQPGNKLGAPRFQPGNHAGGRRKGSPNKRLSIPRQLTVIRSFAPDSPVSAQLALKAIDTIIRLGTDEQRFDAAMLLLERIAGRPKSRRLGK